MRHRVNLRGRAFALTMLLVAGCCNIPIQRPDGTVHHLIIGIGVVTVPATDKAISVLAVRAWALGLHVSDQPGPQCSLGYASSTVLSVPVEADCLIEVSQRPFGPYVVEIGHRSEGGEDNESEKQP